MTARSHTIILKAFTLLYIITIIIKSPSVVKGEVSNFLENKGLYRAFSLYGLPLFAGNRRDARDLLALFLRRREKALVFTPNLEMLSAAKCDPACRAILSGADLLLPDGVGAVLISLGRIRRRIPGIEAGEALLSLAADHGYRVFLLGGRHGIAERAADRLRHRFVGLRVVGTHHGYFEEDELPEIIEILRASEAELLIVCMGFPKQEKLLLAVSEQLPTLRVGIGLGGALDVWSGSSRRAPLPSRLLGLEWLYRILCEPARIPRLLGSVRALLRKKERSAPQSAPPN